MSIQFHSSLSGQKHVAIIAPSACALQEADLERGLQVLRDLGWQVHNFYQHQASSQRFGGTDASRLQQLNDALDHPEVNIILALRGSYGLSRLLDKIDYQKIAQSQKLLVGHSDFNALQLAMLAKTGTASLCGPMLCNDFSREILSEFTQSHFLNAINNRQSEIVFSAENNPHIHVSGTLWGGNLAMVVHLLGTEYFPHIESGILFLEDVGEHPYRVERMLLQLHYAGVLAKQKAIVLGAFSAYRLAEHDHGYNFDEMLAYLRRTISTPIITGLPFGHIADKVSLMQGAHATLRSEQSSEQSSEQISEQSSEQNCVKLTMKY